MRYGQSGQSPHEVHNFSRASDGFIYGYLPKEGGDDLARLGGHRGAEEVSGVTVIFISSGALCGYYRNATVFFTPIKHPDGFMAGELEIYCRVKVAPENAYLIPADRRDHVLRPRPAGMFPVLYGDTGSSWVEWFEGLDETNRPTFGNEKKRSKWTKAVERSSKAREVALTRYGFKCECCDVSHEDNVRAAMFEVHHKVPYSENFETRALNVSDLAVLCANCHRMIHRMPDLADIKALRDYVLND
ncbi:HNH endonuclease [Salipiger marinus]|uniref:HNH endonuclease n=1 Tax=Salipiger marinus TaxID=555512 RepID=UPI0040597A5A